MAAFTIDGIASGFDTTSIISSLVEFQEAQVETYNSRKSDVVTEQSAFKGIEAQLLTLQSSLGRLGSSRNSVFDVRSASSSNEDIISVAASSGASPAKYNLKIESLATAHQIGSQGVASAETLAQGEYVIQVGDRAATTITIDSTNNTLAGFVETVNENVEDLSASLIFDQGTSSNRLLLTSDHTGTANEITISATTTGSGAELDFSGDPIEAAADAIVKLGSGPGAITASYSTNTIDNLIEDVTLDIKSADPDTTVTIDVASDTETATSAIESFVDNFNSIMTFIDEQTSYDSATDSASPLLGDRNVTQIQDRLRSFVIDVVEGLDGANRLADIGVDIGLDGQLTIDSAQLEKALNGELEGVDPDKIPSLFGLNATSTNTGIDFIAGSSRTTATGTPIDINITQAAERAVIAATEVRPANVVIDSNNNTFTITLNGNVSEVLTLAGGSYTPEELAAQLQSVINNSEELGSNDVEVTVGSDNRLSIASELIGSESSVASLIGTASSALGFSGTERDTGQDVEGEFIIDGVVEIANGNGQVLSGDPDNELTADLQLRVSLGSDSVTAGNEGQVSVTRGVSGVLANYLADILDSENGKLKTISDQYDAQIESIEESIAGVEDLTEAKRDFLVAEFAALETIINELKTTGDFLTAQFASLNGSSS